MKITLSVLLLLVACTDPPTIDPTWPKWTSLPLTVSLDTDANDYSRSLNDAISLWNTQLGRVAFRRVVDMSADVTVGLGSVQPGVLGTAAWTETGGIKARVELLAAPDITQAYWVLTHELGHVLGLAHDDSPASIMFRTIDRGLMGEEEGRTMFIVQSADVKAINARYP